MMLRPRFPLHVLNRSTPRLYATVVRKAKSGEGQLDRSVGRHRTQPTSPKSGDIPLNLDPALKVYLDNMNASHRMFEEAFKTELKKNKEQDNSISDLYGNIHALHRNIHALRVCSLPSLHLNGTILLKWTISVAWILGSIDQMPSKPLARELTSKDILFLEITSQSPHYKANPIGFLHKQLEFLQTFDQTPRADPKWTEMKQQLNGPLKQRHRPALFKRERYEGLVSTELLDEFAEEYSVDDRNRAVHEANGHQLASYLRLLAGTGKGERYGRYFKMWYGVPWEDVEMNLDHPCAQDIIYNYGVK